MEPIGSQITSRYQCHTTAFEHVCPLLWTGLCQQSLVLVWDHGLNGVG